MNGILLVNKEYGCTSRDVVNEISKIFCTKKIGHNGTLDPIATGTLVLCIGEATKLVEILTATEKEYVAEVTLGIETDTLDNTGNILNKIPTSVSKEKIKATLASMLGFYNQEVPIYSAIKINGKKLYEYARNNQNVELPKRMVEIKELELLGEPQYKEHKTIFKIRCLVSKGTYIRSLVRDIATKLNTVGVMSALNRTKQGDFSIENSYTLNEIKSGKYKLIDISEYLKKYKSVIVDENIKKRIMNGAILPQIYNEDIVVFYYSTQALAIYKTYEKDKTKIKPWKIFKNE